MRGGLSHMSLRELAESGEGYRTPEGNRCAWMTAFSIKRKGLRS